MTAKRKPPASPSNSIKAEAKDGQTKEALLAQFSVEPCMTGAAVATVFARATFGETSLSATCDALLEKTKRVHDGNLRELESTLTTQAAALNTIFTDLARRAAMNAGEYMHAAELYLKLALRAQNQCRMTLETLATIKNPPPVAFVRQANIAHGPQQVNNGNLEPSVPCARAEENANQPNKLLEAPHDKPEWMDAGTARKAAPSDPPLATVEAIDRAGNG